MIAERKQNNQERHVFVETALMQRIRELELNKNLDDGMRYKLIKAYAVAEEERQNDGFSHIVITEEMIE